MSDHLIYLAAEELNQKNGWDMKIHVDAASGGFVAPFIYPDLEFDFRLKNVNSVSASGHKYVCTVSNCSVILMTGFV